MMREVQINRNLKLREDGKLFNIRTGEEFISKSFDWNGYIIVYAKGKYRRVHQLVMEYFGEPCPGPGFEIDHRNQNPLDNNINNLRWVTHKENMNNRKNNLPGGKRLSDFSNKTDYTREYFREYRKKKKEGG